MEKQRTEEISEEEDTKKLLRQKTRQAKLKKWRNQYLGESIREVLINSQG